ncbi:hypothetical protein [Halobacillus halophilus]|uniref:hypothetical protein n=1 Tax=Halobacillus halophilus TaxID=1570 RepID=UPI001CD5C2FA|nr:hypothetical protein [Halobacillus halophilus]MCA1012226.1 hypothetical protein [Halobacillus halophilus]
MFQKFDKIASYFIIPFSVLVFVVTSYAFQEYLDPIATLLILINFITVVVLITGMYVQKEYKKAAVFSILLAAMFVFWLAL